jgi:RNA polymerase-binding transcription factor DksA
MKTTKQDRSTRKAGSRPRTARSLTEAVLAPAPTTTFNVPRKWAWHYRVLLKLRERLRAERGEQLSEAAEPLEPHGMDIADTATDEFDHDLAISQLSAAQDALYEIEEALRHIRDGTYGVCEETGKQIPAARLRAIPWARFCRETQARLEQKVAAGRKHPGKAVSIRETAGEWKRGPESDDERRSRHRPPTKVKGNRL